MKKSTSFVNRTQNKLEFAKVHLDELKEYERQGTGDLFDRAHEESFLFHLLGVIDAFLHEINILYKCSLPLNKVKMWILKDKLDKMNRSCPELEEIYRLQNDSDSWLYNAIEMRNHSTHRSHLSRIFERSSGGDSSKNGVRLRYPRTGDEEDVGTEIDVIELFDHWYQNMDRLIKHLRELRKKLT